MQRNKWENQSQLKGISKNYISTTCADSLDLSREDNFIILGDFNLPNLSWVLDTEDKILVNI